MKSLRAGTSRLEESNSKLLEIRLRPKDLIKMKSNILIWDDHVAIVSLKDTIFGIVIENHEFSWMLKTWFEFIWNDSKKVV